MNIYKSLIPEHQNNIQRKGFAFALIAIVILAFLHNPMDGYRTAETKTLRSEIMRTGCTQKEIKDIKRFEIQSVWPIDQWDFFVEGYLDPLPNGITSWPKIKQDEWRYSSMKRAQEIRSKCIEIETHEYEETLPFSDWTSNAPLVNWLGSVVHLLGAVIAVVVAGLIWLFVFSAKSNELTSS